MEPTDNQEIERLELESRRDKCQHCCGTGIVDTGGFYPWGASVIDVCPYCCGSGEHTVKVTCEMCHGCGGVYVHNGATDEPSVVQCPQCDGKSKIPKCRGCDGLGTPAGEAAGLICGACMGTGIECNVCED